MSISAIPPRAVAPPSGDGAKDFMPIAQIVSGSAPSPAMNSWSDTAAREDTVSRNPSPAQVNLAVNQVNDAFNLRGQSLYAAIENDKETGIHIVKVLDKNTKEIVSQYPSKEIVAIAASITQYQESRGNLLNVTV